MSVGVEERVQVILHPGGRSVFLSKGSTLLEAVLLADTAIESPCGGKGRCCQCVVEALGHVSPLSPSEEEARRRGLMGAGHRLACQAMALGTVEVRVVKSDITGTAQIMEQGWQPSYSLDPNVKHVIVELGPPAFEDQLADKERLEVALARMGIKPSFTLPILHSMGDRVRDYGFRFALTMIGNEVVDLKPTEDDRVLGVALDIGTTTVVGYLMDLTTGKELAIASALNPQSRYGFDVISRIMYAVEQPDGVEVLSRVVRELMNRLIKETCERVNLSPQKVYEVSVVGNTTMTHLFLGINPHYLAIAPYVPVMTSALTIEACNVGLMIHPQAKVYVLPGIGSFIGADTTGVIVSTQFHHGTGPALAIDIGTNGEIVGRDSAGSLLALSAAAGPAFEGARISSGLRGINGAIERISLSGSRLSIQTIGKVKPIGICGSGLVDALAVMRQTGLVTESGRFLETNNGLAQGKLLARHVSRGPDGMEFLISKKRRNQSRLSITQKDIRELQMAKGAIAAGIKIMLDRMGIDKDGLEEVLLAGAFGNYIDKANARTIGLLPKIPLKAIRSVGNAAGQGAKLALLSKNVRAEAEEMARQVEVINLARCPEFEQKFLESMSFE